MKSPKVSIVIVNWNNYKDTSECLESLGEITYPDYRVIIVDNGSEDGSCQRLMNENHQHQFIRNKENLGLAAASNVGFLKAMGDGTDYVLMLNNDTIVKNDFLEPMVNFLENHQSAGVAGGKIYYYDQADKIWSIGGDVQLLRGGAVYYGSGETDRGQFDEIRQLTHTSGCMSLIKTEVLETVGLLSEQYFFRGEEWDFCYRVSKQGYKLFYIPDSVIWHKVSQTVERFSPMDIYCAYRAKMIFINNFLPKSMRVFWHCLFYLYAKFYAPIKFKRLAERKFNMSINVNKIKKAIFFALKDGRDKNKITIEDIKRVKAGVS